MRLGTFQPNMLSNAGWTWSDNSFFVDGAFVTGGGSDVVIAVNRILPFLRARQPPSIMCMITGRP